jgi:HSP20 family protein
MSIIKWNPFLDPFEEMERMFRELTPMSQSDFLPQVDIYEEKDSLVVEMALPKIEQKDLDVKIENDVLVIQGRTQKKSEVDEKNYYRREMHSGSFYRAIPLPGHVLGDKTKAQYETGVLRVVVPKETEKKEKSVQVKVETGEKKK